MSHIRLSIVLVSIVLLFFLFVVRLVDLQLLQGEKYYQLSQRVIRTIVNLEAPRGEVFDRHYTTSKSESLLIKNIIKLQLSIIVSPSTLSQIMEQTSNLEHLLKSEPGSLLSKIKRIKNQTHKEYKVVLIEDLQPKEHTIIADYYLNFPNFVVEHSIQRHYTYGSQASHITGYIGPPTKSDIKAGRSASYQSIGKSGIEKYYDALLRGEDGEIIQIKTASGNVQEQQVFKDFYPGNNLVLTIDAKMQTVASRAMQDYVGALVVLHASTGEILAMVSKPDYDPNILISPGSKIRQQHLHKMKSQKSELNRAISTKMPPASTFKPLVALVALEENRIQPSKKYFCPGKFTLKSSYPGLPDTTFFCWARHGSNHLVSALAYSCNSYFYQLGYWLGAEPIIKYAKYFKLHETLGIDLPYEIPGFVPSSLWKEKHFKQRWFDGDTINLSIGQGFIQTTLIGMVSLYASIMNGGIMYKPHLLKEVRYPDRDYVKTSIKPEVINELPLTKESIQIIREGLSGVVSYGSASKVFRKQDGTTIPILGKTGTVQIHSKKRHDVNQHGWFIGYGPKDNIQNAIVVGVFIEAGISGSYTAAPVSRKIFDYWFKKKI